MRALQIIDSAVNVGNLSQWQADMCRARIYSSTLMYAPVDSLLGGSEDIRLDTAQAIGERLLNHDSIRTDLKRQQEVLEILAYTDRMQNDTVGWMQRSNELVGVCRQIGPEAETDALRTEAEIGAALCALGQYEQGMAKMDSVIDRLEASFHRENDRGTFDKLDALIIASKRKILILGSQNQYAETLPLARNIIERLDDYEAHPVDYHDGSHREPKTDERRDDYIQAHEPEPVVTDLDLNTLTDEQLFQHINEVIVREKLFLDPKFERQTIMDRFDLSKERVGAVFSKGSDYTKLSNYIQQLRLEYAAKLLAEHPEMSIVQIASECGFSSHKYFSERFRLHYSMTPTEFRQASQQSGNLVGGATDEV